MPATATATTTATTMAGPSSMSAPRTPSDTSDAPVTPITTRIRICTAKPAALSIAPIATAETRSTPTFWKKRMVMASRPAALGTARLM